MKKTLMAAMIASAFTNASGQEVCIASTTPTKDCLSGSAIRGFLSRPDNIQYIVSGFQRFGENHISCTSVYASTLDEAKEIMEARATTWSSPVCWRNRAGVVSCKARCTTTLIPDSDETQSQSGGGSSGGGGGGAGVAVGAIALVGLAAFAFMPDSTEFTPSFTYDEGASGSYNWSNGFWSGHWNSSNHSGIAYDDDTHRFEFNASELSYNATASYKLQHEKWTLTPNTSLNYDSLGGGLGYNVNVKLVREF